MSRAVTDFFGLDESQDKIRQRTLAGSDLVFDPNIAIYQHPLNIKNIIEGSDEAFGEMMRIFALGHPDEQIRKQAQQYVQKEEEIENLKHGQINEIDSSLNEELSKVKEQIEKKKGELQDLQNKVIGTDQNNHIIKAQIESYQKYINQPNNHSILSKLSNLNNSFRTQNQSFQIITQKLQLKTKYLLSKFDFEYHSIGYENKQLVSIQEQLTQLRTANDSKKVEIGTVNRMGLKLEDEVDAIEENLNREIQNLRVSFDLNQGLEDENQNQNEGHSSLSQDSPQQQQQQYVRQQAPLDFSSQSKTYQSSQEQKPVQFCLQNKQSSSSSSSSNKQSSMQRYSDTQIQNNSNSLERKSDKSSLSNRSYNWQNGNQRNSLMPNRTVQSQLKQYHHVQKRHDYGWIRNVLLVLTTVLFVVTVCQLL